MKRLCICLTLLAGSVVAAAELTIKDLSIPQLDVTGRMIRRLRADSASGPLEKPKLSNGIVEFFRLQNSVSDSVSTLHFTDATYQRFAEIIEGDGQIRFDSPKGILSGNGFQYYLAPCRLTLKSAVVIDLPAAHITGKEAEAFFSQSAPDQDFIIKQATILGGVVVTGIKNEKYNFDRAETESAIYTASDGMLRLSSPVVCWRDGEKILIGAGDGGISIDLRKKPDRAAQQ
jgi:hypothetical protein